LDIFLQVWGGAFYLLAKIFLSLAEGEENSKWRVRGWIIYLFGVPPWVIVLAHNRNWIATAIEAGGVPAMILGIIITTRQLVHAPPMLDRITRVFVWGLMFIGVIYSVYDFGGITALSQILECGVTAGFLIGTYLLAKKDRRGWLCFMLMNTSMGTLMAMQEKWIFSILQAVSLHFVISGWRKSRRKL